MSKNITSPSIKEVFELQKKHQYNLKKTNASLRIAKLKKLREKVLEINEDLYVALAKDYKKPRMEADLTEVLPTVGEISEAIKNLHRWMKPKSVDTPFHMLGSKSEVRYEPLGQSLIIAPWNYPFQLTLGPLIAAIAAANTVIIKPSEYTPATSQLLEDMLKDIFPTEEVAVFQGDYKISTELLKLPFDHIFFTGSPNVGKIVMEAAAKNLTKVTLELGGKSPVIIDDSANLKDAAKKIAWGKFINAGQTCVAPDYVLISPNLKSEFIGYLRENIYKFYGAKEDQWKNNLDLCHIVNQKHYLRIESLVKDAKKDGATIELGGIFNESDNFISPTIVTNVPLDSRLMNEEIFGPILPIIEMNSTKDAIDFVNAREKPLALYVFSSSMKNADHILNETSAGGSCINDVVIHLGNPKLPFGGVNHSGLGSYHGEFGFKAFSHERAVLKQNKLFSATQSLYPPYNSTVIELFQNMLRRIL